MRHTFFSISKIFIFFNLLSYLVFTSFCFSSCKKQIDDSYQKLSEQQYGNICNQLSDIRENIYIRITDDAPHIGASFDVYYDNDSTIYFYSKCKLLNTNLSENLHNINSNIPNLNLINNDSKSTDYNTSEVTQEEKLKIIENLKKNNENNYCDYTILISIYYSAKKLRLKLGSEIEKNDVITKTVKNNILNSMKSYLKEDPNNFYDSLMSAISDIKSKLPDSSIISNNSDNEDNNYLNSFGYNSNVGKSGTIFTLICLFCCLGCIGWCTYGSKNNTNDNQVLNNMHIDNSNINSSTNLVSDEFKTYNNNFKNNENVNDINKNKDLLDIKEEYIHSHIDKLISIVKYRIRDNSNSIIQLDQCSICLDYLNNEYDSNIFSGVADLNPIKNLKIFKKQTDNEINYSTKEKELKEKNVNISGFTCSHYYHYSCLVTHNLNECLFCDNVYGYMQIETNFKYSNEINELNIFNVIKKLDKIYPKNTLIKYLHKYPKDKKNIIDCFNNNFSIKAIKWLNLINKDIDSNNKYIPPPIDNIKNKNNVVNKLDNSNEFEMKNYN